jgi:signal transduction histidine kinase
MDARTRIEATAAEQLIALSYYLAARREAILDAWEAAVAADPTLQVASRISLTQFRDLMPNVLENFEERLRKTGPGDARADIRLQGEEQKRDVDHGLHRWKQGYSLHDVIVEWTHLQLAVQAELERYEQANPRLEPEVMPAARRLWTEICGEGMAEGVAQYNALQKAEADGHLRDLQKTMEELKEVERQRAESWHEAAHDLRGNVGIVTTTTYLLAEDGVPERSRSRAVEILQSSVSSLRQLLEDLMSLARLESGREQRRVEPFDASDLLRRLGESLEPLARERGLDLVLEGPATFPVEGDSAKVWRIVQNLTLNALRYTAQGGARVTWKETRESDVERWLIRIQDTGPGLEARLGSPIAQKLEEATDRAREVEKKAVGPDQVEPIPPSSGSSGAAGSRRMAQQPGEGIGLSIVKRLCELLEASLEVATEAGRGTTFQVSLPRRYSQIRDDR